MKALVQSFVYACRGFIYCLHYERNMRIHLAFTLYMYIFVLLFDFFELSRLELAVLFIANALVLMAELLNTAVENTINLVETKYNTLAKIAKDTAAAAVLVGALFAAAIGFVLLWQPDAFTKLISYYATNTPMFVGLVASLIISLIYIFVGPLKLWGLITGKPYKPQKNNNGTGATK